MEITITGRRMPITDPIRAYAEEKIGNSMKVMDINPLTAEVVLQVEKNPANPTPAKCEVTMRARGHIIRVEETDENMYAAIDVAAAKVLRQLRKYKTRIKSQRLRLQRARSHRCRRQPPDSAFAHGDPPRPPLKRHGSLQPQASLVCFNDVHSGGCSPRAAPHGAAHECPLQPQISLCQPWERWAPTAAAGQRERKRAFDALPTMQLRPQLRNNQPFTKAK